MSSRNTPKPVTPRSKQELNCELKDYEPPPLTYKKYQLQEDGTEIYIGEFPSPDYKPTFLKKGRASIK